MSVMTISLPDDLRQFVESQVAEEGHASADAYLLAILEEARRRKARKDKARRDLIVKLDEALASGPAEPMTREDWDALERNVWERHRRDHPEEAQPR